MKKLYILILATIICFSLSGCGKSKPAKEVERLINEIGTVTTDSGDAIEAAEDYYETLTPDQKNEVENYKTLVDARKAYDDLYYFPEYPTLKRPDGNMHNCPLISENNDGKYTTYTFSLGDDQIESIAIAKAEEYIKAIKKDGFDVQDGIQPGYYIVTYDGELVCTIGLNAIEGSGYCMLFVF